MALISQRWPPSVAAPAARPTPPAGRTLTLQEGPAMHHTTLISVEQLQTLMASGQPSFF
jgi:hypothetical protein